MQHLLYILPFKNLFMESIATISFSDTVVHMVVPDPSIIPPSAEKK